MKKSFLALATFLIFSYTFAQQTNLPVKAINSNNATKPLVIYITGDGGWNNFSSAFINQCTASGFPVVSLNARTYFWEKKTPQQTAADINKLALQYAKQWNKKEIILVGYSFGANVMPYVANNLSAEVVPLVKSIVMMSPTKSTDFEVHVPDMLGLKEYGGYNVADAAAKITKPVLFVFGIDERSFPVNKFNNKTFQTLYLPGGHHYDSDAKETCSMIMEKLK